MHIPEAVFYNIFRPPVQGPLATSNFVARTSRVAAPAHGEVLVEVAALTIGAGQRVGFMCRARAATCTRACVYV